MKKFISVLALGLAACGGGSQASGGETTAAGEEGVPRDTFIRLVAENLPGAVCENDAHPVRTCVNVTSDVCTIALTSHIQPCADQLGDAIPAVVPDTEEAGARYGLLIGECIGERYFAEAREAGTYRSDAEGCQ